jgi:uncharacterized membrane protein YciS (DUF1049 family)
MKFVTSFLTVLLVLALLVFAVVFALANAAELKVDFLAFELTASAATWLIGALALGGTLGLLAGMGVFLRLKTGQARSARKIKQYEQEIGKIQATAVRE